ncbi:cytochrome P450 [Deinococcus sp. HMF7620]|uniref:Cytochrome P450 n=1 Tax=Deinococcus arboris TaxID=2682977 RepID=A0A7C9HSJ3_9DEIO|nr:cytochrome P450 [Deinococcus arboris]MVN87832.1 cytochrome P450 [Deinococcus arboris]
MTTPEPQCPFGHGGLTRQADLPTRPSAPVQPDPQGVYQVHGFQAAREVLRSEQVIQAGFGAEQVQSASIMRNKPVLYTEGQPHHEMRRDTARYFTPAAVATYQPMIAALADDLMGQLVRRGQANVDDLSLTMAVRVAAQVVGLTDSLLPGLDRRVTSFVEGERPSRDETAEAKPAGPLAHLQGLWNQRQLLAFYLLDVKPAIQARRRQPKDDLISHLIGQDYTDLEILTECLTYGTAGMVTTREFITVAAWHMLREPELRRAYVHGTEPERHAILHEILRAEPVVSMLYRRTQGDLTVAGQHIPGGSLVAMHIYDTNADPAVAGDHADQLCPARPLPRGVQAPVLAFGDGHHRCPGAFLAIKESDTFLRRLLVWNDLRLVTPPTVTFNEVVKGYELRGMRVALGPAAQPVAAS